jgi:hypothetical protein
MNAEAFGFLAGSDNLVRALTDFLGKKLLDGGRNGLVCSFSLLSYIS